METTQIQTPRWAIRPLVPEDIYTDREDQLNYFNQAAINAITRRTMSTVLLGRRRMGKTEIFKRVVNRLFFEQENYGDIKKSVVPVYYSFPDSPVDQWEFSQKYVENFIRWYSAFRLRDITLLSAHSVPSSQLMDYVKSRLQMTEAFKDAVNFLGALLMKDMISPLSKSLYILRNVSDWEDSTIAVFLDEFQNTRLPQYNFDIVGWMKEAVESNTCPHFVTGSAMSILGREILGRGSLFGRFQSHPIEPMTEYWGAELALKSARFYHVETDERLVPVIAARCGGAPYYITAVIQQAAEQHKPLISEETINEMLAVDLSSGFIWGELSDQVNRWIERTNEHKITKWILYLSALEEGDRINLERIQKELFEREGKNVSLDTIRDVLVKLSRGDLLEFMELGGWFRKTDDPILLDFLKVWGKIEVEGYNRLKVRHDLVQEYNTFKKRIYDHKGYLAEIYMSQVLWNLTRKTLDGRYFHSPTDIQIPWEFFFIHHRVRLQSGEDIEIDLYGGAGTEVWIAESKWRKVKVGEKEVKLLLHKAELARANESKGLKTLRVWFFSYSGFSETARQLMTEKGVLWSTKDELNQLLALAGLRQLPNLDENE